MLHIDYTLATWAPLQISARGWSAQRSRLLLAERIFEGNNFFPLLCSSNARRVALNLLPKLNPINKKAAQEDNKTNRRLAWLANSEHESFGSLPVAQRLKHSKSGPVLLFLLCVLLATCSLFLF